MTWRAVPALAALFLLVAAHGAAAVSCLDAAGNAVDWWIALKVQVPSKQAAWHTCLCTWSLTV